MPQEEVLVLGASGLVGAAVVRELRAGGIPVVAVSRRAVPQEPGVRWIQADLSRPEDVDIVPSTKQVVSTLAIWLTAPVAKSLSRRGMQRLVAFSSTSALTKSDASDDAERQLSADLLAGEVTTRGLAPEVETTILRPTMIYGGGGDANVERIARTVQKFGVFPLVRGGRGLRQPVHASDLGKAAVQALETPITAGRTYNVSGGEVISVRQLVERVASAQDSSVRFVHIPMGPAAAVLSLMAHLPGFRRVPAGALERMSRDLVFANDDAARDFGYSPQRFTPPVYPS